MSDLFHPDVSVEFIKRVFASMSQSPQHQFQVLTKRSKRLAELAHELDWPGNVWMGVSVESSKYMFRISHLAQVPAEVRFLSCEPLLGPLDGLDLSAVHWVIAGGESGSRARPMDPEWVRSIRDQCIDADRPFFFKQWGGRTPKAHGRHLDGAVYDGMPESAVA